MMKEPSPIEAVQQVLLRMGVTPSNVLCMMLIDAVRNTTPPPREVTIGYLSRILESLSPTQALDDWTYRSSREIVKILSDHPAVKAAAKVIDSEHVWDQLEGTIAGMLMRVCTGKDLEEPAPKAHELSEEEIRDENGLARINYTLRLTKEELGKLVDGAMLHRVVWREKNENGYAVEICVDVLESPAGAPEPTKA